MNLLLKGQPGRVSPQVRKRRGELGLVARFEYGKVVVLFLDGCEESLRADELQTSTRR